jgi:HPt (histidine-containing phosphotransfer) domain-containing protein
MTRLRSVTGADVPLHLLTDRLRDVGHWVPPDALEAAIDAAIEACPPGILAEVRAHLRALGAEDGPEQRALFARLLELFARRAPGALGRLEAAVDAGDGAGAAAAGRRLARQAQSLGAHPLARLCTDLADRADGGDVGIPAASRAALRREVAVTCRVLATLAAELLDGEAPDADPAGRSADGAAP